MLKLNRYTIKVAGESGQGINSLGEILASTLKQSGLYTFGYREFPSLIKGGNSSYQIDLADRQIRSPSEKCDILICLSRASLHHYLSSLRKKGQILHFLPSLKFNDKEQQLIDQRQLNIVSVPAGKIVREVGGIWLMVNTVMLGVTWGALELKLEPLIKVLKKVFADKPEVIEKNLACLQKGFEVKLPQSEHQSLSLEFKPERKSDAVMTGNHGIALGAIAAGVRAYYAYPMSPSSSILSYLSEVYHQTGMLVKQIEDEISVAQMAIGSMFAGTRALVGTSGGGFDLMTESLSLAAMTETPFVCVIVQRPGPSTGLPTWTSSSDLNLAVYSGHGEYTRLVVAASDPASCYTLIQKAFNLAEEFQIPVLVLSDKQAGESLFQIKNLPKEEPIERHLVAESEFSDLKPSDRFRVTPSGVSKRWLPGQSDATYVGNSDEHLEDGSLTEEAVDSEAMYDKRLRKEKLLLTKLPEPVIHGPDKADLSFIGWGSVKNTVLDAMEIWNHGHPDQEVNYLHFEYIFPLKTKAVKNFARSAQQLVLIEQNAFGQLGQLILQKTDLKFADRFLKYDGRPFFVEEVLLYLSKYF